MRYLTFALAKGRLAKKTLALLEQIGITCDEMKDPDTRKLIFVNEEMKLKFFLSKATDVPTYVEYGAADIGVVGKDTILEEGRNLYEVMDLGFGKCRMCVCGPHKAKELLKKNENIKGIYGCNNTSTVGIAKTLTKQKRTDIVMVGFDMAEETKQFIKDSDYRGVSLMQKQDQMGYLGIGTLNSLINGKKSEQKYFDTGVIMIDSDYLMEKKEKKRYIGLSSTDALTGILNRRAFQVELEEQIRKKEPGFFIFIDVDNFKSYNDTYGHNNGDLCLKHFAKAIQECFPEGSILGRYGGDEFVVYLKDVTKESVYIYMEKFQKMIADLTLATGEKVHLSASAGGAAFPEQGEDFISLCRSADAALYNVKQNGKGAFKIK